MKPLGLVVHINELSFALHQTATLSGVDFDTVFALLRDYQQEKYQTPPLYIDTYELIR